MRPRNDERDDSLPVDPLLWQRLIDVTLSAYFFAANALVPGMRQAKGEAIINISSIGFMMVNAG